MTEFTIRDAAPEDFQGIHAIFAHSVETGTASFNLEPPSLSELVARMERLNSENLPFRVAEHAGAVIGFAWCDWFRPRPGYRFTLEDSIYVADAAQGRGVGKTLLTQVVSDASERGFKQIIAVIGDTENIGSIKAHEACGFVHAGILKNVGLKFDRWLDSVYMQKSL